MMITQKSDIFLPQFGNGKNHSSKVFPMILSAAPVIVLDTWAL